MEHKRMRTAYVKMAADIEEYAKELDDKLTAKEEALEKEEDSDKRLELQDDIDQYKNLIQRLQNHGDHQDYVQPGEEE